MIRAAAGLSGLPKDLATEQGKEDSGPPSTSSDDPESWMKPVGGEPSRTQPRY